MGWSSGTDEPAAIAGLETAWELGARLYDTADGYGHGAVPVARAALDAGASWLGVALVEEGAELRAAGIDAPILVLSEPPPAAAPAVVGLGLTPVAYTPVGIEALAKAVAHADTADEIHIPAAVASLRRSAGRGCRTGP